MDAKSNTPRRDLIDAVAQHVLSILAVEEEDSVVSEAGLALDIIYSWSDSNVLPGDEADVPPLDELCQYVRFVLTFASQIGAMREGLPGRWRVAERRADAAPTSFRLRTPILQRPGADDQKPATEPVTPTH